LQQRQREEQQAQNQETQVRQEIIHFSGTFLFLEVEQALEVQRQGLPRKLTMVLYFLLFLRDMSRVLEEQERKLEALLLDQLF
jgi:hypothetical protein